MANLQDMVAWCDRRLASHQFKDYCPNGLQIEGTPEVSNLVSAVTASLTAIEAAIDLKADALIVHHGYFWKGEPSPLTGLKGKRIRQLIQKNISLIAYHLPLDAHPQLGNNAALADVLNIRIQGPLDATEKWPIGNVGMLDEPLAPEVFAQLLQEKLFQPAIHIATGKALIQTIGFCTGAAQDFLSKAAALNCDAYLSGEVSERTFHEAHEYGIDYFAAGHHATERYGIQRLASELAQQFNLNYQYIELNNPI